MNTTTRLLLIPLMLYAGLLFAEEARLLREPDISADTLVFSYARDIWRVPLEGGEATRISSFQGREAHPRISPDGQSVAFTGEYDGNLDVYVNALGGGEPKRLDFPSRRRHRGGLESGWPVCTFQLAALQCTARLAAAVHGISGRRYAHKAAHEPRPSGFILG